MLATLALAAVLQPLPAQNGKLDLTNVRATYGILGAERKSDKVLPGDLYVVSFDIEGLPVKDTGEMNYSMGTELVKKDPKGDKSQFKNAPRDLKAFNLLGSAKLPAFAYADVGLDTEPGKYTFIVTVIDPATKTTKKLERPFEVLKKQLGIVRLWVTDARGEPMAPVGVVGQNLFLSYGLVGFDLDKDKNPNLSFEMWLTDKDGKKTFTKAAEVDVEKAANAQTAMLMPRFYQVPLTRSGTFTVQLKATDIISKTSVEEKMTITVIDLPK
jgi:hypothetical protein